MEIVNQPKAFLEEGGEVEVEVEVGRTIQGYVQINWEDNEGFHIKWVDPSEVNIMSHAVLV